MCFVWIWEQTAIVSLYSIDWLVFITNKECVAARYVLHSTFCPHSVFMCFVWIWEQTAIISLYSINWLVFITETECVYCAVRSTFYVLLTQCIYVFCVDLRTISDYFTVQHWLVGFYNWEGVCLLRGTDWVFIYIKFKLMVSRCDCSEADIHFPVEVSYRMLYWVSFLFANRTWKIFCS